MLFDNYWSWKPELLKPPKTWKTLCFPSTVKVDSRNFRVTVRADIPFNLQSWQSQLSELSKAYGMLKFPQKHYVQLLQLSELPKTSQQLQLTFLSTLVFTTTTILLAVGIETGTWNLQASCQLLNLKTITFRATKILSTVGVDIPVHLSSQICQNL